MRAYGKHVVADSVEHFALLPNGRTIATAIPKHGFDLRLSLIRRNAGWPELIRKWLKRLNAAVRPSTSYARNCFL